MPTTTFRPESGTVAKAYIRSTSSRPDAPFQLPSADWRIAAKIGVSAMLTTVGGALGPANVQAFAVRHAHHGDQSVRAEIDLAVEPCDRVGIVRRGDHAGECAVRIVQTADHVDLPQLGDLALGQLADEHLAVVSRQRGFVAEIVTVADIGADDRRTRAGPDDALRIGDEQLQRHVGQHHHLDGARRKIEMLRIALPLVFQDAQRLVERQQLAAQLFLERQRGREHLGLYARTRLAAMCANCVAHADPGQRDQHQRGDDNGSPAEAREM